MSNVLRHPSADAAPVVNPRRRGRLPANVAQLHHGLSRHEQKPQETPAPSSVHIVVHDGAVSVKDIDIKSKADAVEILLWLYIQMGQTLQDINRFGWGPR